MGTLTIKLNACLDLVELVEDERVRLIAVRVVIGKSLECLGLLALGDKPTRRLGREEDERELKDRGETLEDGGDTPRPVVVDKLGTKRCPRRATPAISGANANV